MILSHLYFRKPTLATVRGMDRREEDWRPGEPLGATEVLSCDGLGACLNVA